MADQLLTIPEWINRTYAENSRPALRTVRQWIRNGLLAAERHGRTYYLKPDTLPRQPYRI
ncbi:hypothetical protein HW932_01625 [Allochromatium humboldtianum]|uniref:Excisionase-like domain-containing protein n=1 Tax=Allochromatium humboldtianum TaxID=504901 RepID=A0A850R3N3_9GAMM|nr:excisionase [Allochromatium humboldtianum]NVZ07958.1 hypothetical protein [Allochromatium humboldtianum]